jgi:hypothetical protein
MGRRNKDSARQFFIPGKKAQSSDFQTSQLLNVQTLPMALPLRLIRKAPASAPPRTLPLRPEKGCPAHFIPSTDPLPSTGRPEPGFIPWFFSFECAIFL